MVRGDGADALQDSGRAVFGRDTELRDLTGVHGEPVDQSAGVNVPQADGEVDATRQQVSDVVAVTGMMRIEKTVDAASMSFQNLVLRPVLSFALLDGQQVRHDCIGGRNDDDGTVLTTTDESALVRQVHTGSHFDFRLVGCHKLIKDATGQWFQ